MVDLKQILARAQAKAERKAKSAKTREESGAKFQQEQRTNRARKRSNALREQREKSGLAIAESFIEEVAPAFIAMMQRDDASKLNGFHITFRTSKTDQGPFSASIRVSNDPKKGIRHYPNGTIREQARKHGTDDKPGWLIERLLKKLEADGGTKFSTRADCLEEILRLRQLSNAQQARMKRLEANNLEFEDRVKTLRERNNDYDYVEVSSPEDSENTDDAQEDAPADAVEAFDVQIPTTSDDDAETSTEEAAVAPSDVPATS